MARRVASVLLFAALAGGARAGTPDVAGAPTALESIRARGFLQCASVERPGLATFNQRIGWTGLEVDLCRAIATAVLGPSGRFTYHGYGSARSFDSARDSQDQLVFLSAAEMSDQDLTDRLRPGPTIFVEGHDLLVARGSQATSAADLARTSICFIIASPANDSLEAWFGARALPIVRYPFREEDEMYDTYAVQRCKAVAGETTALAEARRFGGINHLQSRLLPEHLATFPIYAATPLGADPRWAAIVAWSMATLRAGAALPADPHADAAHGVPTDGKRLGLAADWQTVMLARTGDYAAMFERNLGRGSGLALERGLN